MAGQPPKLLKNVKSHLTKEEIQTRKDSEEKLFAYSELNIEPPEWLKESPVANDEWDRVTRLLLDNVPVSDLDYTQIAAYCSLYADLVTCQSDINERGLIVKDKKNIYLTLKLQIIKDMRLLESDLGMSLVSRQRLELNKAEAEEPYDPFEEFGRSVIS